ncbi:MAG: PIN domain-containing protein [Cyclobacteriaceae bacterium]|nr:PIN domain-containing protein [Cyclobacteriaceae bacterium SS2]
MSSLLLDTNIVLDLLARREPFHESAAQLFSLADKRKIKLTVSSLTFANTNYVLSRLKSAQEARDILRRFKILVRVLSLNNKIVELSLNDEEFNDFEDGLQYYSALENNQDFIITRDLKGFKKAKIPVMTAAEYLASIETSSSS